MADAASPTRTEAGFSFLTLALAAVAGAAVALAVQAAWQHFKPPEPPRPRIAVIDSMALASAVVQSTQTPQQAETLYREAGQKLRDFADKGWVVLDSRAVAVIAPDRILTPAQLVPGLTVQPIFIGGGASLPALPVVPTPSYPQQTPGYAAAAPSAQGQSPTLPLGTPVYPQQTYPGTPGAGQ